MQSENLVPLMNFGEVCTLLKQRFPMIMVDAVLELVPEQRILTLKNVTGNEIQFLGRFSSSGTSRSSPSCPAR